MNSHPDQFGVANEGDRAMNARMDADLPRLLSEVRLRARRRRARAVVAGALCLAPIVWSAAHLASPRMYTAPDRAVVHNDSQPQVQHADPPDGNALDAYEIGDDEFFRLMNRAGYDVGLVRKGSETILIGFDPPARETEGGTAPSEPPGASSLE